MDFPNNPADGSTVRVNGQRYIATGGVWEKSSGEKPVTVQGGVIDLTKGAVHVLSLSGTAVTVSVNNQLPAGNYDEFLLELFIVNPTVVTWPSSFKWDKGTPPTLPSSGRAIFAGYTRDGGARYEMVTVSSDSR
jgi:hypothetical protein